MTVRTHVNARTSQIEPHGVLPLLTTIKALLEEGPWFFRPAVIAENFSLENIPTGTENFWERGRSRLLPTGGGGTGLRENGIFSGNQHNQ